MLSKVFINNLHSILQDTQKLEPITTNAGQVILSKTQIDDRLYEIKDLIKTMERCFSPSS